MTNPQFYQTEPQQVEAIQFLGGEESANAVIAWAESIVGKSPYNAWHPYFEGEKDVGNTKPKFMILPEQVRLQGKTHPATVPVGYYLYIVVGTNQLRTMNPVQFEEKFKVL